MTSSITNFTPREIVGELDRFIVGQAKAKRAVAIAMRNRWRRQQVPEALRDEIAPKNIIMIGPTGVGKTEIARRLSKLAQAPFVKVEASKFTEVGYVGRDVESIIRDLMEVAIQMVRNEELERVQTRAREHAEERLVEFLSAGGESDQAPDSLGPFVVSPEGDVQRPQLNTSDAGAVREKLRAGDLDEEFVEFDVTETGGPMVSVFGGHGMEDMEIQLRDMLGNLPGFNQGKKQRRKVRVIEARKLLEDEEANKLIDMDQVKRDAVTRTEQAGIVFLDEIDKIAGPKAQGPDVSREGVQRDLLPIVEGSTVTTKYGPVRTDHILFIAAGAFHASKVSDLIPEMQGRFPIRVELDSLGQGDFVRILKEPDNALTRQYAALMLAEGITLEFTDEAIEAIAEYAAEANRRSENIGARRLHTIMEALLEELSFNAPERTESAFKVDLDQVRETLGKILSDESLARFIL